MYGLSSLKESEKQIRKEKSMERLTTRHSGVAVIKDKSKMKEAMEKLARYEDLEDANLQAKDLVAVKVTVYLEIKDSEVYGGKGSVGYSEYSLRGNAVMLSIDSMEFANIAKHESTNLFGVPEECIRIISEEEYSENTDDDEE